MFAINHAATGLLIKKAFPEVPMLAILVSVQLIEGLWVVLNALGIEKTTTEASVASVRDVHLSYMPFSHSVASTLALALAAGALAQLFLSAPHAGLAIALGVCSHLVLDLVSHARDIVLAPFGSHRKFGLGLYDTPPVAFAFEIVYGLFCWWMYGGSAALFWVIIGFNLANASFFIEALPGPERLMANRPAWITGIVAAQIVVTAALVGWLN